MNHGGQLVNVTTQNDIEVSSIWSPTVVTFATLCNHLRRYHYIPHVEEILLGNPADSTHGMNFKLDVQILLQLMLQYLN